MIGKIWSNQSIRTFATTVIEVKPHIPLIKFRKGGNVSVTAGHQVSSSQLPSTSATQSNSPPIGLTPRGSGIDESLLPSKYHRTPITALEMEIVEQGGAY